METSPAMEGGALSTSVLRGDVLLDPMLTPSSGRGSRQGRSTYPRIAIKRLLQGVRQDIGFVIVGARKEQCIDSSIYCCEYISLLRVAFCCLCLRSAAFAVASSVACSS